MEVEAWQLKEIKEALKMADSTDAKFFDHKSVCEWICSWGFENEKLKARQAASNYLQKKARVNIRISSVDLENIPVPLQDANLDAASLALKNQILFVD